ncbi:hypothetical protein [Flavobacterium sp. UMI-01]|uniref:hypothetical protein n=1 Tax=Flavobacterium sp. UMI-01 TaxID=1441053 RepID=UPI00208D782A|nr:hypothetical protein [Flavobacterium sp. UMI-01]GIZ09346.1 hypothetical protein FUMI01_20730 [Flavobacterium sp. UMI-01]
MKSNTKILSGIIALLLFSCTEDLMINETKSVAIPTTTENTQKPSRTVSYKFWDFENLDEWEDASQNMNGQINYSLDNGNLYLYTRPYTIDRPKVKSMTTYSTGTYTWRVFVPEMGVGDRASIGAFLYNDDTHELDFEIGYGSQNERIAINAAPDDLLAYMTSQANPFQSNVIKIKRGQWYTLSMELTLNSKSKYFAKWKIDGSTVSSLQLNYGTKEKFKIFCSVENLNFIGDHTPYSLNYALFDFVKYQGN